jgi:hypothetical protein
MKAMIVILTKLRTAITGMLMSMTPSERDVVAGLRKVIVTPTRARESEETELALGASAAASPPWIPLSRL